LKPDAASMKMCREVTTLLETVLGQAAAVTTLRRALASGRVHHAYLFDGPDGVGKELAAFGLAQALVCETRAPGGDKACGACSACTRAAPRAEQRRPVHPDVVVLERALYEPAQIGRRSPETQDLSIDQVRTLVLARAAFGPHEGRAKVFIVRRAEELSISASNALLKTLEEPGKCTHFVLLSARPNALLDTIRSRTQAVRFAPLPDSVVERLAASRGVEPERAREVARLSAGSVETALLLADPERSTAREHFVQRALAAIDAPDVAPALALAEDAKKAKTDLDGQLSALAAELAARAREAVGSEGGAAESLAARYELALAAIRQLDGNASAQLVVESMVLQMRRL
jgi:DNA polymerase-3 subunit delta'